MAASSDYWHVVSGVQSELQALAALGDGAYNGLEAEDDPGVVADSFQEIKKRLDKLSEQIGANIVPLRKIAKALDDLPGFK